MSALEITHADLVGYLTSNLSDPRLIGVRLFLSELLARKAFGGGIEENRLYTINSEAEDESSDRTYITDMAGLVEVLNQSVEGDITATFPHGSYRPITTNTIPCIVTLNSVIVELHHAAAEDEKYIHAWGGAMVEKSLIFTLAYLNDSDETLPLKITNISLG